MFRRFKVRVIQCYKSFKTCLCCSSSVAASSGTNSREGFRDSGGWNCYDNNMYGQDGGAGNYEDEESWDQDSGSDYDDFGDATYGSRSRKKDDGTGRNKSRSSRPMGRSVGGKRSSGGNMGIGSGNSKRRTHADNIPDSEQPFSCDRKPHNLIIFFYICIHILPK